MADNLLDKSLKITLCDERVVYGIFHSMDSKANMIIMDATIQLPQEYVAPLNEYLDSLVQKYFKLPQSVLEDDQIISEFNKSFWKNKNYSGQVMVPGHQIKKVEIQV